jgi:hypothetical protein
MLLVLTGDALHAAAARESVLGFLAGLPGER